MAEKRFRTGKGILEEGYPSETIIDNETGKTYYKGYANYKSAKEMCELLNKLIEENEQLKQFKEKVFVLLDEKIKHYEHKPFSAPVGQPMSVNFDADVDRLARLSELQDLEKELKSE